MPSYTPEVNGLPDNQLPIEDASWDGKPWSADPDDNVVVPLRKPSARHLIFDNGFPAIVVDGKAPVADEWQLGPITEERLRAETERHPGAKNTGARTGELVPFDIDINDPAHAEQIKSVVFEVCGPTPWVRVGSKGFALCYRNRTPIAKAKVVAAAAPGEKPQAVEVLGTGQQLVVDGIHPDTGKLYRWIGDCDPTKNRFDELPLVTPRKIMAALDRIAEIMAAQGYKDPHRTGAGYYRATMAPDTEFGRPGASKSIKAGEPLSVPQLTRYLSELDPPDDRDGWRDVVVAIRACPGPDIEDLRGVAYAWSRGELMFDGRYRDGPPDGWSRPSTGDGVCGEDAVDQIFATMPPKPGGLGIGSLIAAANKARQARGFQSYLSYAEAARLASDDADGETPGDAKTTDEAYLAAARMFPLFTPIAGSQLPPIDFWDAKQLLPKGGSQGRVGIAYARSGGGKTTIEVCLAVEACLAGARVLYIPIEGGDDVMVNHLPAACTAHGITLQDLTDTGRWLTSPAVFQAKDLASANALRLVLDVAAFKPDLIFVDTFAAASVGMRENDAETAASLLASGAFGFLARTYTATVLVAHHTGKDETRGPRGTSGLGGNCDFVLKVDTNKAQKSARVTAEKMRGGRDGYAVNFIADYYPNAAGVPTIAALPASAAEVRRQKNERAANDVATFTPADIGRLLDAHGCTAKLNHTASNAALALWMAPEDVNVRRKLRERLGYASKQPAFKAYVASPDDDRRGRDALWRLPHPQDLEAAYDDVDLEA